MTDHCRHTPACRAVGPRVLEDTKQGFTIDKSPGAELVLDEKTGFWLCPVCHVSYGRDAKEPYDPSIQELEE